MGRRGGIGCLVAALIGAIALLTSLPSPSHSQTQQCVASAQASGTSDAITIPALPCGLTTNLLILTTTASNATTTPTLQPLGSPAQTITRADGTALAVGDIGTGSYRALLTATGSKWLLLNPATIALSALPLNDTPLLWQPRAGQTQGQGCAGPFSGHFLGFINENYCALATIDQWVSTDPSILATLTLGGAVNVGGGAGEQITFTYGTVCASGCTVSYVNQTGDTLSSVGIALANAVKANATLYNGNATTTAQQLEVIWATGAVAGQVNFDFNGNTAIKVTYAAIGGSTVTGSMNGTCSSSACPPNADVPMAFIISDQPGFVVASGSTIWQEQYASSFSGGNGLYAQMTVIATDPTTSKGTFLFTSGNAPVLGGLYIGAGIYGIHEADPGNDKTAFQGYRVVNGANGTGISILNDSNTAAFNVEMPILAANDTFAMLARNQVFTGNNTHNGTETFSGGVTFNTIGVTFGDGGTWTASGINGSIIGSSSPKAGTFTTLTDTGL